jgi:hypothetical protein
VTADPLHTLWQHQGSPRLTGPGAPATTPGTCARCHQATDHAALLTDVISDKWTGWQDYATGDRTPRWCPPCAWGHTEPTLRHLPWLITTDHGAPATLSTLHATLTRPLPADVALLIPLTRKKHLLPAARWGLITVDDLALPWRPADADRLTVLTALRAAGFTERALGAPAPRFEHLRTLTPTQQAQVLRTWALLDPWRAFPAYLQIALLATRKDRP